MSVPRLLRLADGDNVYVAAGNLRAGTQVPSDSKLVLVREDIELGHKVLVSRGHPRISDPARASLAGERGVHRVQQSIHAVHFLDVVSRTGC